VGHSAHHKHSYYLIRNGELLGYTETEIEIIANLARYHRRNTPKSMRTTPAQQKYRQLVNQLSALLRLAVALDQRQIGAMGECSVSTTQIKNSTCCSVHPNLLRTALWNYGVWITKGVFEAEYGVKLVATLAPTPLALS